MYVIEHPLLVAPATDSAANVLAEWNALYDAYNEVSCLILGSMTPELHRQFENSSPYDMIQELKSMFEKQTRVERPTGTSWLYATTRYYIGLILNGLTKDFVGFMRNYNMHNMGKTIGELHAMLIEYEKGLPKKAETPQVMIIKGGKIQKSNKKSLKAKGKGKANGKGKDKQVYNPKPKNLKPAVKEHPAKDDTCHHCKELQQEGLLKSTDQFVSCLSGKMIRKSFPHRLGRATDLLGIIHTDVCGPLRHVSRQGFLKETMGYYFYFSPENKIVVARYAEFFKKNLITQEVSGRAKDLEKIQNEDTTPSEITSEIPMEVEGFKPPQEEVIPICRSIFKKKTDMDGIVHTYKAHLVAKGYTQLYGVDYEETFLPAADTRAIRILLSIAAFYDYKIWQMDVKTTFLNGYLDEDIYMVQPKDAEIEAVWIRKFISSLGIVPTINEPIKMFCDNSAALPIASEPRVQMGTRQYHRSNLLKVHTDANLAYPFMKALPEGKLTQHARSMGLCLASSFM
uniref:Reverse transcriptase Ty1/copia-type domain-containing protein n=1 Tax=Tanacetum cinerariifolium TaxID=118510 RepID=A0A6L2MPX3_TANCI|nr:hypothetical protein [Tanacetum cinerariifolium]